MMVMESEPAWKRKKIPPTTETGLGKDQAGWNRKTAAVLWSRCGGGRPLGGETSWGGEKNTRERSWSDHQKENEKKQAVEKRISLGPSKGEVKNKKLHPTPTSGSDGLNSS